jgi:hypothetical protein
MCAALMLGSAAAAAPQLRHLPVSTTRRTRAGRELERPLAAMAREPHCASLRGVVTETDLADATQARSKAER